MWFTMNDVFDVFHAGNKFTSEPIHAAEVSVHLFQFLSTFVPSISKQVCSRSQWEHSNNRYFSKGNWGKHKGEEQFGSWNIFKSEQRDITVVKSKKLFVVNMAFCQPATLSFLYNSQHNESVSEKKFTWDFDWER